MTGWGMGGSPRVIVYPSTQVRFPLAQLTGSLWFCWYVSGPHLGFRNHFWGWKPHSKILTPLVFLSFGTFPPPWYACRVPTALQLKTTPYFFPPLTLCYLFFFNTLKIEAQYVFRKSTQITIIQLNKYS